jgi:hypothetical protein
VGAPVAISVVAADGDSVANIVGDAVGMMAAPRGPTVGAPVSISPLTADGDSVVNIVGDGMDTPRGTPVGAPVAISVVASDEDSVVNTVGDIVGRMAAPPRAVGSMAAPPIGPPVGLFDLTSVGINVTGPVGRLAEPPSATPVGVPVTISVTVADGDSVVCSLVGDAVGARTAPTMGAPMGGTLVGLPVTTSVIVADGDSVEISVVGAVGPPPTKVDGALDTMAPLPRGAPDGLSVSISVAVTVCSAVDPSVGLVVSACVGFVVCSRVTFAEGTEVGVSVGTGTGAISAGSTQKSMPEKRSPTSVGRQPGTDSPLRLWKQIRPSAH